jgi:alpha-tubulin suppressor-like RCC1 family protein
MNARRLLAGLFVGISSAAYLCCAVEGTVLREVDENELDGALADSAPGDATKITDAPADADTGTTFPADAARGEATGVFTGQYFSCDLVAGLAACWGSNVLGQLGTGGLQDELSPTALTAAPGFTVLSAGESHTCGLAYGSGAVYCWGSDAYGQLGQGEPASTLDASTADPSPLRVWLAHAASTVAAGYDHACAILGDGSLWCWGDNQEGQLGLDDPYGAPNYPTPQRVGTGTDWRAVSGGQGHSCGLRASADGGSGHTLWCWGRDSGGELGLGTGQPMESRVPTQVGTASTWAQVDLGQDEACAVRTDGTLWCWGGNIEGELTPAVNTTLYVPTQIGTDSDWSHVDTDTFVTCALKTSGALYCWGRNVEGQLGVGDTNDRTSPTATGSGALFSGVSVGRFHTCARTTAGKVLCAGDNESGQLGVGDSMRRNTFTAVAP